MVDLLERPNGKLKEASQVIEENSSFVYSVVLRISRKTSVLFSRLSNSSKPLRLSAVQSVCPVPNTLRRARDVRGVVQQVEEAAFIIYFILLACSERGLSPGPSIQTLRTDNRLLKNPRNAVLEVLPPPANKTPAEVEY